MRSPKAMAAEPLARGILGLAGALLLATRGLVERSKDGCVADWEADGIQYLARVLHDTAEANAALAEDRPMRWEHELVEVIKEAEEVAMADEVVS